MKNEKKKYQDIKTSLRSSANKSNAAAFKEKSYLHDFIVNTNLSILIQPKCETVLFHCLKILLHFTRVFVNSRVSEIEAY